MTLDEFIATTVESLRENGATPDLIQKTVADLKKAAKEEKDARQRESAQRAKYDFAFLASDPKGVLKGIDALTGWVFQIERDGNPATLHDRAVAAANTFNTSRKGRKRPVTTIGETVESVPARFWKTDDGRVTRVKTKTPVYLVTTTNALPSEKADKGREEA